MDIITNNNIYLVSLIRVFVYVYASHMQIVVTYPVEYYDLKPGADENVCKFKTCFV